MKFAPLNLCTLRVASPLVSRLSEADRDSETSRLNRSGIGAADASLILASRIEVGSVVGGFDMILNSEE
jgi:hypothetical protein